MRTPKRIGWTEFESMFPGSMAAMYSVRLPLRHSYGQMTAEEMLVVCGIIRSLNAKKLFEIGTFDGLTTLNMLLAVPDSTIQTLDIRDRGTSVMGSDGAVYDKDAHLTARERWQSEGVTNRVTEIHMDSWLYCPTSAQRHKMDVVFIDGNHAQKYVEKDTDTAFQLVRPGGVVLWHDYFKTSFPGVTAAVSDLASKREVFWMESREDYLRTSLCFCIA